VSDARESGSRRQDLRESFADLEESDERSTTLRALAELTLWFRVRAEQAARV
jgi:hypothetical protein